MLLVPAPQDLVTGEPSQSAIATIKLRSTIEASVPPPPVGRCAPAVGRRFFVGSIFCLAAQILRWHLPCLG